MKISFAICTHNEGAYVDQLLTKINKWILLSTTINDPYEYEVVIVDDFSTDETTLKVLSTAISLPHCKLYHHRLDNNFAEHKNFMNSCCTGDWILNLDADEWVPDSLLDILPMIVESNPQVDAFWLPRVNTVDGLTLKHVQKWRWIITTLEGFRTAKEMDKESEEYKLLESYDLIAGNEDDYVIYNQPIINFPDPQMRFYKNSPEIKWIGKVHERLDGFKHYSMFPTDVQYAIRHHKEISRQEKQNELYERIT